MGAKRSPILGYNHNVRFRGIVFHVQTEDSGIINPHVFTHLFHGGVILSTRKLVYDPDATEEVVKSLMQAQHKAAMKDLRRGFFDDKIDVYLVGTPGLLPREGAVAAVADEPSLPVEVPVPMTTSEVPNDTIPVPTMPTLADMERPDDAPSSSPELRIGRAPTERAAEVPSTPVTVRFQRPTPPPEDVGPEVMPPESGAPPHAPRAATLLGHPTLHHPAAAGHESPPDLSRRDVSEAMKAIQVGDDELAAAGLVEMDDIDVGDVGDVAEIHSPALPSVAAPPGVGERPGQYSERKSGKVDQLSRPPIPRPTPPSSKVPTPPPAAPARPPTQPNNQPRTPTPQNNQPRTPTPTSQPRAPTPASQPRSPTPQNNQPRTPTPGAGPLSRPTPPAIPRMTPPPRVDGRPPAPTPTTPPAAPRGRPPSGGGVVVSRPAVIVGGPARTVGGPVPPTGGAKVRRAKDTESGIGSDLISERSLDEVILAYLSEDTSDE